MNLNPKDYDCSIHGNDGELDCQECCNNLQRLIRDANSNTKEQMK